MGKYPPPMGRGPPATGRHGCRPLFHGRMIVMDSTPCPRRRVRPLEDMPTAELLLARDGGPLPPGYRRLIDMELLARAFPEWGMSWVDFCLVVLIDPPGKTKKFILGKCDGCHALYWAEDYDHASR